LFKSKPEILMTSFINTNMASLNTQRNLSASQASLNTSIQRLSSGMRVNSAKDDAAGMAIASRMDSNIRGNTVAMRNANDAISFSQTAEGALSKVGDNLQRMRELAVQAANGSNGDDDRDSLDTEFKQLQAEITRVTGNTKFNGVKVLGSEAAAGITFQIGSGTTDDDKITVTGADLTDADSKTAIAAGSDIAIGKDGDAAAALDAIDDALKEVNTESIKHGATQNRFSAVISTLQVSVENQTAARSRIMDTDFASETATMARGQILQQAGMAMLAQANQLPNGVMALLR
jgi:flagellin